MAAEVTSIFELRSMLGQETVRIGLLGQDVHVVALGQFGVKLGQRHLAVLENAWSESAMPGNLELAGTAPVKRACVVAGGRNGRGVAVSIFLVQSAVILRVWISCFQRSFSWA
jgi:hypothetical protein